MNFLQMGETWVDMDKVYAVRRENHRDYLETQPRIVYMLRLMGEEQHIAIHEADAAPLLAWLEANQPQPHMEIMAVSKEDAAQARQDILDELKTNDSASYALHKVAAYLDQFWKHHRQVGS